MSMTRKLGLAEQGRDLSGKPVVKDVEPSSKNEEVVPWLWDFAYLYSPGGFNLEDGRSKDSQIHVRKPRAPEPPKPVSEYPIKAWKTGISCSVWSVPDLSMHPIFRKVPSCETLYDRTNDARSQITLRVINAISRPAQDALPHHTLASNSSERIPLHSASGSEYPRDKPRTSKRSFIKRLFSRMRKKTESIYQNYTSIRRTLKRDIDYDDRDLEATGELLRERFDEDIPEIHVQPPNEYMREPIDSSPGEASQLCDQFAPRSLQSPDQPSPGTIPPPYQSACELPPPQYSPSSTELPLPDPPSSGTFVNLVSKVWTWIWGRRTP